MTTAAQARIGQSRGLPEQCNHGLIPLVVLLELKGDGYGVSKGQHWVIQGERAVVADEFEVAKAEAFGATLAGDGEVFARAHGKEECAPCKLMGGLVERAVVVLAELTEEAGCEGLLGTGRGVTILVPLQLV